MRSANPVSCVIIQVTFIELGVSNQTRLSCKFEFNLLQGLLWRSGRTRQAIVEVSLDRLEGNVHACEPHIHADKYMEPLSQK